MRKCLAIILSGLIVLQNLLTVSSQSCNGESIQDLNATYIIGGLFPVHYRVSETNQYIFNILSIVWVEAFLFALREINNIKDLLPGIKLGYDIKDTCNDGMVAENHVLDLMTDRKFFQSSHQAFSNWYAPCECYDEQQSKMIGVVGGASSTISSIAAHTLIAGNIPQISYASTSPLLSNSRTYPNFLRTIPSDLQQVSVVTELLQVMDWTYVSLLATDDDFGRLALNLVQENFKQNNICIALEYLYSSNLSTGDLAEITRGLSKYQNRTKVVIIWATEFWNVEKIITNTSNDGLDDMLWIVLSESWITKFQSNLPRRQHVIMLQLEDFQVESFVDHMNKLSFGSDLGNIWMPQYWTSLGICPENEGERTKYCYDHWIPEGRVLGRKYSENVIASVYAFAYGLHKTLDCNEKNCEQKPFLDYEALKLNILANTFILPSTNLSIEFQPNGDVNANSYQIRMFSFEKNVLLGSWSKTNNIQINQTEFWLHYDNENQSSTNIPATCSTPCKPGFYKRQESQTCCWSCIQCPYDEVSLGIDSLGCQKCGPLEIANKQQDKCVPLPNKEFSLTAQTGLIIGIISLVGFMFTLFTILVYMILWETPGVKSTNRELSLIQLVCILLLFCFPVLNLYTHKSLCIARQVIFGSLHSLILVLVLLKTYRLFKLFQPQFFKKHTRMFLTISAQIFFAFFLLLIETTVLAMWYTVHQPSMILYSSKGEGGYIYHCGDHESYVLYAIIIYVILLSLASGFIAFRARSLPANFNEAQYIWLAMFTYCIIWCAFFPLHLSSNKLYKSTILLSMNLASTFSLIAILFGNKIRMLVCLPHLNNRLHFTGLAANAYIRTFSLRQSESPGKNKKKKMRDKKRVISFSFELENNV
eukprot:TCONS_00052075-protein